MKKKQSPRQYKFADILICIYAVFGISMLLIVCYYSLLQWVTFFKSTVAVQGRMFWVALLIAIVSGLTDFLASLIRQFAISYNNLANK